MDITEQLRIVAPLIEGEIPEDEYPCEWVLQQDRARIAPVATAAADTIDHLRADAESFHMAYRMKCDKETKDLRAELAEAQRREDKARCIRCGCPMGTAVADDESHRLLAEVDALKHDNARLVETCAEQATEVEGLRKAGGILAMRVLQSDLVLDDAEVAARDHLVALHMESLRGEARRGEAG